MVDFRKCIPALAVAAVVLGSALTASAQVAPPFTCTTTGGVTPQVRAEGLTELVGDIILTCTGGTPTPAGQLVPQVNIQVFLNTNVTSRIMDSGTGLSEAVILIDDPTPGVPNNTQFACAAPTCPVTGVFTGYPGTGVNFKNGNVAAPNVFQGRKATDTSITWLGVPVDPPGTNGTRTLRLTNIRADATHAVPGFAGIGTIQAFVSVTPGQSLPINQFGQQTVAIVGTGLAFSLRTADNTASTSGVTFLQCTSNNKALAGDNTSSSLPNGLSFNARFAEGFASSFKKRNVSGGVGNADVSPAPLNQDNPQGLCTSCFPVQNYFTETGFYNAGLNLVGNTVKPAGLADFGTRLQLKFDSVPAGAQVFVGAYEKGTTAATSHLRLVSTDTGAFSPVAATSTAAGGLAPVSITAGSGIAVYEVMSSDPQSVESFDVPVVIAYVSNTSTNTPGLGTATVTGSFAPISTVNTQSSSAPIPRFAAVVTQKTGFTINACSTNLLFPFVSNTAGFDTGIAIANTSVDPFGTATQAGACKINYYGTTTGGGAAPAQATSPTVAAGTELVFTISSGGSGVAATPGFQGYIIAQCAFQYAHGFAFISDIGGQKLAEGYLALVMDSAISTRSGTSSESLNQ